MNKFFIITAIFMCSTLFAMEPEEFTQEDYNEYCAIRYYFNACKEIMKQFNKNSITKIINNSSLSPIKSPITVSRGLLLNNTGLCFDTKWGLFDSNLIAPSGYFDRFLFYYRLTKNLKIFLSGRYDRILNEYYNSNGILQIDDYKINEPEVDFNALSDEDFEKRTKQWIALKKKYADERIKLKTLCINFIKKNLNKHNFDLNKLSEELRALFPENKSLWTRCAIQ